jgi:hypothetical protein
MANLCEYAPEYRAPVLPGCTVILEYSITPILVDNVYYPPVVLVYMQKTISGAMGRQKLMWGPRAP